MHIRVVGAGSRKWQVPACATFSGLCVHMYVFFVYLCACVLTQKYDTVWCVLHAILICKHAFIIQLWSVLYIVNRAVNITLHVWLSLEYTHRLFIFFYIFLMSSLLMGGSRGMHTNGNKPALTQMHACYGRLFSCQGSIYSVCCLIPDKRVFHRDWNFSDAVHHLTSAFFCTVFYRKLIYCCEVTKEEKISQVLKLYTKWTNFNL